MGCKNKQAPSVDRQNKVGFVLIGKGLYNNKKIICKVFYNFRFILKIKLNKQIVTQRFYFKNLAPKVLI